MKYKKLFVLSLVVTAAIFARGSNAFAATKTWTGSGGNGNFSTSGNWNPSGAPVSGDSIVLPVDVIFTGCTNSTGTTTINNDLVASSVTLAGISLTGQKPVNCYKLLTISGNEIKSSGNVGTPTYRVELSVPLSATADITVSGMYSSSSLSIGANNVSLNGGTFDGAIAGSGNLTLGGDNQGGSGGGGCSGTGTSSPFAGDGSGFSGGLLLGDYGSLGVSARSNDIARHASSIALNSAIASIQFNLDNGSDMSFSTPVTLNGGNMVAFQEYIGVDCTAATSNKTVTITSNVTLTVETTINLYKANIVFSGSVTGKDFIKVADGQEGMVSFADGSTLKSVLKVVTIDSSADCNNVYTASSANTRLIINADCSTYASFTNNPSYPFITTGILSGTGKMFHVKIGIGGVIAPGLSPGTLTVGNIEWVEGGIYEFEIGKDAADKIVAIGTVTLGNGTLTPKIYGGAKPTAGKSYVIIDNDGADAVVGTFKGLAEGATFKADGYVYKVSYVGGTGNDVILTVVSIPATPDTGFGMLQNNPVAVLIGASVAAGAILMLSRRMKPATKRSRR